MGLTRKNFLKVFGLVFAGAAVFPINHFLGSRPQKPKDVLIRVQPISGRHYSPSFLRLCEHARFSSVEEALRHIKDRSVSYGLSRI
jgi:hypothetical protein